METEKIIKSTQEQAVATWIDYLRLLRVRNLLEALKSQDINLKQALIELQKLVSFVGDPAHILGSPSTKHGEIAENAQVYISNARRLIEGLEKEYSFDGVGRTAPEDYLYNDLPVQSKFYNSFYRTFDAIMKHLKQYPDFLKNNGTYEMPVDQYEKITQLLGKSPSELSRSEYALVKAIQQWESKNGVKFTQIVRPSVVTYSQVQQGTIGQTIAKEDRSIRTKDQQLRKEAYEASQPILAEGLYVTEVSAAIEGGLSFVLAVAEKLKTGKSLSQFTAEDWKDVGIDTGVGTIKGGIRGGSVYALTNFTATPAPIASAYVTAIFGMIGQAAQLEQGNIDAEEFVAGTQAVCLEAGVSAVSSLIGQAVIPIPVLGAVIGNAVGTIAYSIASDYLGKEEQAAIADYIARMDKLNAQLEIRYQKLLAQLKAEFEHFKSLLDFAFDLDANVSFYGSIVLADEVGVPKEKILHTPDDVTRYFTE